MDQHSVDREPTGERGHKQGTRVRGKGTFQRTLFAVLAAAAVQLAPSYEGALEQLTPAHFAQEAGRVVYVLQS